MKDSQENLQRISLRDVLFVIFTKFHVFVGIYATIVATTAVLGFVLPPVYLVSGDVLVKPMLEPNLKLFAPAPTNIRANPVTPQDLNSEVAILKSPQLLRQVVRKLNLDQASPPTTWTGRWLDNLARSLRDLLVALGLSVRGSPEDRALAYLQKKLDIKPITLSNMMEVSLKGDDPEQITKIINTLLESYIDYHIQVFRAGGAKDFYARQAELFQQRLKDSEAELERFKGRYGVIDITAQNEANIELVRVMRENLALVEAKVKERQAKVGVQARNLAQTGEVGALTPDLQSNLLEELVRVLGPLLAERERLGLHYQKSSLKYQAADRQVRELKGAYQQQLRELVNGAQLDVSAMSKYGRLLSRYIKRLEDQSLTLSLKQVQYDQLVREVKQNEKNYLMYLNKTEEARIEEQQDANRVSNVTVTTWAQLPTIPVFPQKLLMLALAFGLGLVMALAGAFFAYYLDHTIKTAQDLARYTGLPVFATIDLAKSPGEGGHGP